MHSDTVGSCWVHFYNAPTAVQLPLSLLPLLPSVGLEDDMHTHTVVVYLAGLCVICTHRPYVHTYIRTPWTLGSCGPAVFIHVRTYVGPVLRWHSMSVCYISCMLLASPCLCCLCDLTGIRIVIVLCPISMLCYYIALYNIVQYWSTVKVELIHYSVMYSNPASLSQSLIHCV